MTSTVKIPEGWIETTLGEIATFQQGFQISTDFQELEKKEGYVRFVRIVDYTNEGERPRYIRDPHRCFVNEDDLVMIRYGSQTAGKIVRGISGVIANNTFQVITGNNTNKNRLYRNLKQESVYNYLNRDQSSSTMPAITFSQVSKLQILLPPLPEQKAIAGVLSAFDDKIELLRAENQTLEEMGQSLFKERFGKYKVGDELPDGWKEYELSELVDTVNGYSYKGDELVEKSNEALVTLKSFDRNGGFQTRGFKEFKGNTKSEQEVFVGDLVVAHTDLTQDAEVLGNPAFIVNNGGFERLYITMDLVKVNSKNENITKSFLYFLMRTKEFKGHCVGYSNGTTVLHLSKKAIPEYKIVLPKDLSGLKEKSLAFELIMKKISHNFSQIDELIKARDQLLPKLMSGEVRVEF